MSANTFIEWTDTTWNPTRGCSVVSPGCINCYAMKQAHRFSGEGRPYAGLTKLSANGPQWTGEVRFIPDMLEEPLRWRKPRRIFVNSMSDLFHGSVSNEHIAAVFGVMAAAPQHTFQVLTKRAKRMREWFEWAEAHPHNDGTGTVGGPDAAMWKAIAEFPGPLPERVFGGDGDEGEAISRALDRPWPLPNVWLGISVENQEQANKRIPDLLRTPAAIRFLSCEPLIGPVDLDDLILEDGTPNELHVSALECDVGVEDDSDFKGATIDWVIVGGESGAHARPMQLEWARAIVKQCSVAGVRCFVKQLGSNLPLTVGELTQFPNLTRPAHSKGGDIEEWPLDLRVREFPEVAQ